MQLIEEIRARLKKGESCRVISTSLIEAGVDLDFPAVFREEAGLDSILQAAGRCNREGKEPVDKSIVSVFQSEHPTPRLFSANVGAYQETAQAYEDLLVPEAVTAYFKGLLSLKGDALDKYEVIKAFSMGKNGMILPFRAIAEQFRVIDSSAKSVFIPTKENESLLEDLRAGRISRELFRKLGRYSVTVYPQHFAALASVGDIDVIDEQMGVLRNELLYNAMTGLSLVAEEGKLWGM